MLTLTASKVAVRFSGFELGPITLSLGVGIHQLRGQNGSGKTTLMRTLCGDLRPSDGNVLINGHDPWTEPLARRAISWVPATCDLPDFMTVDEAWQTMAAIRNAPAWDGDTLRRSLQLPGDLALGDASVGQRHRAALLAGLAGDPSVLLLDEPLAHLDGRGLLLMATWLRRWREERIVLVATHSELPVEVDSTFTLEPGKALMHSGWS